MPKDPLGAVYWLLIGLVLVALLWSCLTGELWHLLPILAAAAGALVVGKLVHRQAAARKQRPRKRKRNHD